MSTYESELLWASLSGVHRFTAGKVRSV